MMKVKFGIVMPTSTDTHYHHCPECYEKVACIQNCSIEPDLEDPICHPGKEFGAHCICDDCEKEKTPLTKEWWDVYNGFKRK